jgi:LytTr DNA-binding domain
MTNFLTQPYPAIDSSWQTQLRHSLLIGGFVGLFLLAFQPFGLDDWETNDKALKTLGFGVVSFAITLLNFTVWPRIFPRFFAENHWTVGRAIGFVNTHILLTAVCNYLYLNFLAGFDVGVPNLLFMIPATFLVGLFPTAGTIGLNYVVRLRQYSQQASQLRQAAITPSALPVIPTVSTENTPAVLPLVVTLVADNEKDTLTLAPAELLCIESSDNYCTVFFLKTDKTTKILLRSSLSRMETQVSGAGRVMRCHRSFIVNLDRVAHVTGNAQGYKLHLTDGQTVVPVARKYNETVVAALKTV